jgi:hypothetical protein
VIAGVVPTGNVGGRASEERAEPRRAEGRAVAAAPQRERAAHAEHHLPGAPARTGTGSGGWCDLVSISGRAARELITPRQLVLDFYVCQITNREKNENLPIPV